MEEPVETVRALRRVSASELSLDAPIDRGDRDSASFGERFAGAEAEDIEENVESQAQREFLDRMFEEYLTERERKILYLYYGLDDGEERTLEEIGSLLGVTRERIRQIRNRAFEKLRESPDGAQDATICKILEVAITGIWGKVQDQPDSYVMDRDEFAVFNYFQHRFKGDAVAVAARKRYWDHLHA
jgi:DNA-binding CsgD family transcriptional regulator